MKKCLLTLLALFLAASADLAAGNLLPVSEYDGKWIGCTYDGDVLEGNTRLPARYLRKEVKLSGKIKTATLYICGLGLYDAWINGKWITSDQVLSPTVSEYEKRVYCNKFDVASALKKGDNALAVSLGNGRYYPVRNPGMHGFDIPKLWLLLEITFNDGKSVRVASDESWKITCEGPIRSNNEFDGETYDARMELGDWTRPGYDDSSWDNASVLKAPGGKLCLQPNPNIAVQDVLKPVSVSKVGSVWILDMGQNMVGRLQFKARGLEEGDTVTLRFAEALKNDGNIYLDNLRSAKVTDTYVADGEGKVCWHPEYVYHGFRYVEVKGLRKAPRLSDFEGQVMYDKMAVTGHFETSDEVINQVYHNAFWGIRGNYRGMPTDCPQRDERLGWMGDHTMGCYGESWIFDNHALYSKWLTDIQDAQNAEGSLPDIAPRFWTVYSDNLTWPGVFVTATDMLYQRFGDLQAVADHYDAMKKWLSYMKSKYLVDGVMTKDTYGDWCMPPESLELIHSKDKSRITAGPVISTPFYYFLLQKMIRFAAVSGHSEDVGIFKAEAALVKDAYNRQYFNPGTCSYDNGTVTADLLPLYFGMVPEGKESGVFSNIVRKTEVDCGGHVSCGVIGIMVLMRTLTEYGRPDLALKIASSDTYPSWGYMAKNGATTIWELWNGNTADPAMNSRNHVMLLGDLVVWFYEYLGGIRPLEPGFKSIELKPYPIPGLDWVKCSYDSSYGKIVSDWKTADGVFDWEVEVPEGTSAKAYLPGKDGSRELQELAPGKYHFSRRLLE